MRQEEAASRAEVVEEEKLLFPTNFTMVALRGLGEEGLVLGELLLVWEGDTIDALQGVVRLITQEV